MSCPNVEDDVWFYRKGLSLSHHYWEKVCRNYDSEVLSVWDRDMKGLIRQSIQEAGAKDKRAADIGCGVGKFLPLLADCFADVAACDFAEEALSKSRQLCQSEQLENVSFHHLDLSRDVVPFEPVEFVLCVNVLLMGSFDERMRCWRTVTNQVASGGQLVLVLPSLESILMQHHMERDEFLNQGIDCSTSLDRCMPEGSSAINLHQGVHLLEGFPTKHYFRDELEHLITDHHLEIKTFEPIYYRINGEKSKSWDWFVVARRENVV